MRQCFTTAQPSDLRQCSATTAQPSDMRQCSTSTAQPSDLRQYFSTTAQPSDMRQCSTTTAQPSDMRQYFTTTAKSSDMRQCSTTTVQPSACDVTHCQRSPDVKTSQHKTSLLDQTKRAEEPVTRPPAEERSTNGPRPQVGSEHASIPSARLISTVRNTCDSPAPTNMFSRVSPIHSAEIFNLDAFDMVSAGPSALSTKSPAARSVPLVPYESSDSDSFHSLSGDDSSFASCSKENCLESCNHPDDGYRVEDMSALTETAQAGGPEGKLSSTRVLGHLISPTKQGWLQPLWKCPELRRKSSGRACHSLFPSEYGELGHHMSLENIRIFIPVNMRK